MERDFDQAKRSGRWLSDDEMQVLADQEQALLVEQQRVLANRRKMIVLTGVCIVLPPLWPLALLLTLVLLYPTTMKRVGVVSGVVFVVLTVRGIEPRAESPRVGQSLALPVFRMSSYVVLAAARCTA